MNIKIKTTNLSASPVIEEYVFKKVSSLEKFINSNNGVLYEVELAKKAKHHKSGDLYRAEVNITFDGKQFYVFAENEDLYAAIDEMSDEAERSVVSRRKKYIAVLRRGSKRVKDMIKRIYE